MTSRRGELDRPWPLHAIFAVSGCAALIDQVIWVRAFGDVFGNTSRAAAVVLAAFFLGIGAGSALGARAARRSGADALRSYAWIEVAVAISAVAVLGWLALYRGGRRTRSPRSSCCSRRSRWARPVSAWARRCR